MDVKLTDGPLDGWVVNWPDGEPVHHISVPADPGPISYARPDGPPRISEIDVRTYRYQLVAGRTDVAVYTRPLTSSEADALERLIAADIVVDLEPVDDDVVRRGLDL